MSVIEDRGLKKLARNGALSPYDESMVQPASIDLRLGTTFLVQDTHDVGVIDLADIPPQERLTKRVEVPLYKEECPSGCGGIYRRGQECPTCAGTGWCLNDEGRFIIHPGEFVLGCTLEHIKVPPDVIMTLEGKSSLARLALLPHVQAGYFDPGWDGVGTLEIVNLNKVPIILRPGLSICQSRWTRMESTPSNLYKGRYQGATEVEGSRYTG